MEKILELLTTALGSLSGGEGEDSELNLGSLFGSLGSDDQTTV